MTKHHPILRFCFFTLILSIISTHTQAAQNGVVERKDVDIHYKIIGEGFPIVLLSGGPGQNVNALVDIADKLSTSFKIISIDQRGTGKSILKEVSEKTITLANYIADIEAVRKQLGIDRWLIVGHSWGAGLAMAIAGAHPQHSAGMILIGSMGIDHTFAQHAFDNLYYSEREKTALKFWSTPEELAKNPRRAAYELYRALVPSRLYVRSDAMKVMSNYVVEVNSRKISKLMFKELLGDKYDFSTKLSNYNKPVLVVQGRQGFLAGQTLYDLLAPFPNPTLIYIEKAGHFPFAEQPQAFFAAVDGFLQKHFSPTLTKYTKIHHIE
ncbi:MAG: alpha/beta hydrolase [Algicola sp.]|nr:alpha/beta hydrolase [Algicola sp.]